MGRAPCCEKVGLKRGRWTAEEDEILRNYIEAHGDGSWRSLPKNAGLLRCGKSCRLRWINYLRSDLKRGNITAAEEEIIINLHASMGNRWSLIAGHLPGRTDNEIKNYWNSHLGRKYHSIVRKPNPQFPPPIIPPKPTPWPGKNKKKNKTIVKPPEQTNGGGAANASPVVPVPKHPAPEKEALISSTNSNGDLVISEIPNNNEGMGIECGKIWLDDIMDDLDGIWPALDEEREMVYSGEIGGSSSKIGNGEQELIPGDSWRWEWDDVRDGNEGWGQQENTPPWFWDGHDDNTSSQVDPLNHNAIISWLLS